MTFRTIMIVITTVLLPISANKGTPIVSSLLTVLQKP
jgi:hypothetical protein